MAIVPVAEPLLDACVTRPDAATETVPAPLADCDTCEVPETTAIATVPALLMLLAACALDETAAIGTCPATLLVLAACDDEAEAETLTLPAEDTASEAWTEDDVPIAVPGTDTVPVATTVSASCVTLLCPAIETVAEDAPL